MGTCKSWLEGSCECGQPCDSDQQEIPYKSIITSSQQTTLTKNRLLYMVVYEQEGVIRTIHQPLEFSSACDDLAAAEKRWPQYNWRLMVVSEL